MVVPLKKHSCITTERLNRRIVSKLSIFPITSSLNISPIKTANSLEIRPKYPRNPLQTIL